MAMIDWDTFIITSIWFLMGWAYILLEDYFYVIEEGEEDHELDTTPPDTFESSMFMEV